MKRLKILGTGSAFPERVLTNFDLERMVDTSNEWICTRTGIKERRIADESIAASDLVIQAARKALDAAGMAPDELDCIIVATISPDTPFPSTACWVQKGLKIKDIPAFDISAACSGFLYGLKIGSALLESGTCSHILVAGVEILSKITNWEDRNTCVLFGDGAGVSIIGPGTKDSGILGSSWGADGNLGELLIQPAGGSRLPASHETVDKHLHTVHMAGNEVFKHAVRAMGDAAEEALSRAGVKGEEIDLFIPHQANIRIIEATCRRVQIPMEKTFLNIHKYGNMSAATIPTAIDEAYREGRIKPGDIILLAAFGAGFTWAATVLRW
jgi:3-oxoacyl-[acyl-carrier-protein] synthase-3